MRREHYTLPGAGTIVQQPEEGEVLSPRCCGGGPGPRPAAATHYLRVTVPSPEALAKGRPLSTGSCKRTPFCRMFAGFFCKGRPLATGQQDLVEGLFSSTYLKDRRPPPCAVRVLAWSRCHFLIRTTPKTRGLCLCNECIGAQQTLATPGLQCSR
jgi:hypothetical protein